MCDLLHPWKARLPGCQCRSRWSSHGSGSQMNRNLCLPHTAIQVHMLYQNPETETNSILSEAVSGTNYTNDFSQDNHNDIQELKITSFMNRAISVDSVASNKSRAFAANWSASCCIVWSMSVSSTIALPSNMVEESFAIEKVERISGWDWSTGLYWYL